MSEVCFEATGRNLRADRLGQNLLLFHGIHHVYIVFTLPAHVPVQALFLSESSPCFSTVPSALYILAYLCLSFDKRKCSAGRRPATVVAYLSLIHI